LGGKGHPPPPLGTTVGVWAPLRPTEVGEIFDINKS